MPPDETKNASRLFLVSMIGAVAVPLVLVQQPARAESDQAPRYTGVLLRPGPADTSAEVEVCSCQPFDVRVELGKATEENKEFEAYHSAINQRVGDHLAETMRSCFAAIREPETDTFVLVAYITVEGKAKAIEVRPATNIATCFAAGFATALFPRPPQYPDHDGFPMTIEMQIK